MATKAASASNDKPTETTVATTSRMVEGSKCEALKSRRSTDMARSARGEDEDGEGAGDGGTKTRLGRPGAGLLSLRDDWGPTRSSSGRRPHHGGLDYLDVGRLD